MLLSASLVPTPRTPSFNTKNVAAGDAVTAKLPPFAAQGFRRSIVPRVLRPSAGRQEPARAARLLGIDTLCMVATGPRRPTAVAQGTVRKTSAVSATRGASGTSVQRGVPTAGRNASGAMVERENDFALASISQMRLTLKNPDFTTARRIADGINQRFDCTAVSDNPHHRAHHQVAGQVGKVMIQPAMTAIEQSRSTSTTLPGKIFHDETDVTVMGSDVRISQVAIAQGRTGRPRCRISPLIRPASGFFSCRGWGPAPAPGGRATSKSRGGEGQAAHPCGRDTLACRPWSQASTRFM